MEDAQEMVTLALAGGGPALLAVGAAGLGLAAVRWATPYLKTFFKTVAR